MIETQIRDLEENAMGYVAITVGSVEMEQGYPIRFTENNVVLNTECEGKYYLVG